MQTQTAVERVTSIQYDTPDCAFSSRCGNISTIKLRLNEVDDNGVCQVINLCYTCARDLTKQLLDALLLD